LFILRTIKSPALRAARIAMFSIGCIGLDPDGG
jgi:hypothetical protein